MNCINCAGPLPENSEICKFCGTKNDLDAMKLGVERKHVEEEHAFGTGTDSAYEESRAKADKIRINQLQEGHTKYNQQRRKEKITWGLTIAIIASIIVCLIFGAKIKALTISVEKKINPKKFAVLSINKGIEKFADGDFIGAIKFFDEATELSDINTAYYLKGVAYYYIYLNLLLKEPDSLENTDLYFVKSHENLSKAIEIKPDSFQAHYYLGLYHYSNKDYKEALNEFKLSLDGAEKISVGDKKSKWVDGIKKLKKQCSFLVMTKDSKDTLQPLPPIIYTDNRYILFLTDTDIIDWIVFINSLLSHESYSEVIVWNDIPEEGKLSIKRYISGFNGEFKDNEVYMNDNLSKSKQNILQTLNSKIESNYFYASDIFVDMEPNEEIDGYIKHGTDSLSEIHLRKFNRLLLESLFPYTIKKNNLKIEITQIIPIVPDEI